MIFFLFRILKINDLWYVMNNSKRSLVRADCQLAKCCSYASPSAVLVLFKSVCTLSTIKCVKFSKKLFLYCVFGKSLQFIKQWSHQTSLQWCDLVTMSSWWIWLPCGVVTGIPFRLISELENGHDLQYLP